MVSSVLGATSTGEGLGEVTIRPLRPPQRARLLEKWIRVAEVRKRLGPVGDPGVERGPRAQASLCDTPRPTIGVPSAPKLLFSLCCCVGPAVQPHPQASSSLGGSSQVGSLGHWTGAEGWEEAWGRAWPILKAIALHPPIPPETASESSPASATFSLRRITIPRAGSSSRR